MRKWVFAWLVALLDASYYAWLLDFDRTVTIPSWLGGPLFLIAFVSFVWALGPILQGPEREDDGEEG